MKIRGINKKAQGEGIGPLGTLLIVVAVVVIIALAIYFYFGQFRRQAGGLTKSDLDTVITGCQGATSNYAFCEDFKEVKNSATGKIEYVNCNYTIVRQELTSANLPTCTPNREKTQCNSLKAAGKIVDEIIVNGKACKEWSEVAP